MKIVQFQVTKGELWDVVYVLAEDGNIYYRITNLDDTYEWFKFPKLEVKQSEKIPV